MNQKELIGKFFSILDSATVSKCNGVWVLYNGRDMFWFEMENDSLGVFTFMSSQEIAAPKNYFHLLASVDVSGEDDYHVLAQFGVMQRKYPISYGIAAQGIFPSKGIAPIFRLEFWDVIAVQGGPAYFKDDTPGYYLSVDFMQGLWKDIGLK